MPRRVDHCFAFVVPDILESDLKSSHGTMYFEQVISRSNESGAVAVDRFSPLLKKASSFVDFTSRLDIINSFNGRNLKRSPKRTPSNSKNGD
jgi:hypothetical protein